MISVNQGRVRPQNRVPTQSDKQPSARTKTYAAPTGGLITNAPWATPTGGGAVVLENFWPTATGVRPRGGTKIRCMIHGGVEALFQYRAGFNKTFFAADANNVYEFSDQTPQAARLVPAITGQTGADYSTLETQTDGGSFLTIVNGRDHAQIYDGANWQKITASSAPFTIEGVATDRLSCVWSHRNRTFFTERGTMNAWYLSVNSVAGKAVKLPLAGAFNKGGSLLFGATWSSDSGAGMDDRCVFATDRGEFAIYSGGNPGDADGWRLNGVYDIGEPLGKNSIMQVGGDLIVATKAGLTPLSAATVKDPSQLKLAALSRAIDPDWRRQVVLSGNAGGWRLAKWDSRNMAIVSPPAQQGFCWAVNLETGAWTKFTGWRIGAVQVLGDRLYYGNDHGGVYACETGGTDNGRPFVCRACFSFDHLGDAGALKIAHAIRGTWRHRAPFAAKHAVAGGYRLSFDDPPSVPVVTRGITTEWDVSGWDQASWAHAEGSQDYMIRDKWESVSAHGKVLAPQVQITSAQTARLDCELISIDLVYSTGAHLT